MEANCPELDYWVTFPAPSGHGELSSAALVVILGWTGAVDRQLDKYANIYQARGFYTLRFTMDPKAVLFEDEEKIRSKSKLLIQVIYDFSLENCPVVFHCLSTAGAMVYRHIVEEMRLNHTSISIRGVIFDSAPARQSLSATWRTIHHQIQHGAALTRLMGAAILFIVSVLVVWYRRVTTRSWLEVVRCAASTWPELYVLSDGDAVCGAREVASVAAERRGREGREVRVWQCAGTVPHLGLLTAHGKHYEERVLRFLSEDCALCDQYKDIK